jgi:hypothetical protein
MHKITILTGPKSKKVVVQAEKFIPGLVTHTPAERIEGDYVSITHERSGLCVLFYADVSCLGWIKNVLSKVNWDIDAIDIFRSPLHRQLANVVVNEIMATRKDSARQEKRIAADIGGKVQPGSGSVPGYRRDVITPNFLVEAKTTSTSKYHLCVKDLEYLKKQAYKQGKVPAFIIELEDQYEVVILPASDTPDSIMADKKEAIVRKNQKSFSITKKIFDRLHDGSCVVLILGSKFYVMMSYEKFLDFAKTGINN